VPGDHVTGRLLRSVAMGRAAKRKVADARGPGRLIFPVAMTPSRGGVSVSTVESVPPGPASVRVQRPGRSVAGRVRVFVKGATAMPDARPAAPSRATPCEPRCAAAR